MMSSMPQPLHRVFLNLELEERILNIGALIAAVGVILPWISGPWGGQDEQVFGGFGFFTSFIGASVFLLQIVLIAILFVPLLGGPVIVTQSRRHIVRFFLSLIASVLILASLSVLTKVTLEFPRMTLRFGVYVTLIGSLISTLYTYLLYREQRRHEVRELFHHPEDHYLHVQPSSPVSTAAGTAPPPPPPPPPLPAEEHPVIR